MARFPQLLGSHSGHTAMLLPRREMRRGMKIRLTEVPRLELRLDVV